MTNKHLEICKMGSTRRSALSQGNKALREKRFEEAIRLYLQALNAVPGLSKTITANLAFARQKYRAERKSSHRLCVAVCGWELAHNAADRVYTLAKLYETFADVEIIGCFFPQYGRELWEPIRGATLPVHSFVVEDESWFLEQALHLVAAHPYDVVHLSKPRAPNIFFGILYNLVWDARVIVDIDDEELSFVGTDTSISIDDYLKAKGSLPELKELDGLDWTRLAVGLVNEFDGVTVANPALQQHYGGKIICSAQDEPLTAVLPRLKSVAEGSASLQPVQAGRSHKITKIILEYDAFANLQPFKQIEEFFSKKQKIAVEIEPATLGRCSHSKGATVVLLPDDWPSTSADVHQVAGMIGCLEERSSGQFIKGKKGSASSRNRHPYRMMGPGDKIEQYFVSSEAILSSITLYFYTFMKKNGARVRVNIYVVLPELIEHCLATKFFEGDDITDGGAVHLWLEPAISAAVGQIFRIEIIVEALNNSADITVALSESSDNTLHTFDLDGLSKHTLSFNVNQSPLLFANKYFAFVSGCPGDAFRYRCVHIGEALSRLGYGVDVFQPGDQVWNTLVENYKVIVLHRIPYDPSVANFIAYARKSHVLTIFDTDDLIFDPQLANQIDAYNEMWEPDQELYLDGLKRYNKTLSECDLVTVTTERLAQEITRLWPKKSVGIIRNRVSKEMYDLASDAQLIPKSARKDVLIAYFSGSKTHQKDFSTCEAALLKILQIYSNVRLLIVGHLHMPDTFLTVAEKVENIPFVAWQSLAGLYRKVDINLAPLEYDNAFTESKSELKFLEAALLSIPTVAANIGAYANTIENGVDGILCSSSEEWFSGLERLIIDPVLRKHVGQAARDKVLQNFTTIRNIHPIQNTFHQLLNTVECFDYHIKPSIAFILRAPIAKTGGGYKKIFILANYLKNNFNVKIYVEAIAHLSAMTDEEICLYCEEYFNFDHRDVRVGHDKIESIDIVIATNWPTAPTVASLNTARLKFYFVQDYEPDFYAEEDPLYALASATYDLGLSIITIGDYLKHKLESRGGWCRSIPFAMDSAFLSIDTRRAFPSNSPCSVLFFSRPNIPRRNFQAGVDALKMVSAAYPEVKICLYGLEEFIDLPFKYENLGQLSQNELALIMGETDIHLSYSLTNISTVIYEAMACGCACVEADVEPVQAMVKDGHHCLLAEPTGPGTFRVLSRLIDSPSLRRELSMNGQAFAKSLTEKNMCIHFQDFLEDAWMLN